MRNCQQQGYKAFTSLSNVQKWLVGDVPFYLIFRSIST